jgi:hypothetical protein
LPGGIPEGFNAINNAVVNIEAGGTLFNFFVFAYGEDGTTPANADIELRGTRLYTGNLDAGGSFSYDYMHEGTYQVTVSYENPGGGYYYKSEIFDLDENNNNLMLVLDNYTTLTGNVTGVSNPENAIISYYSLNGELLSSGLTNSNGQYSISGLLPGTYIATASWGESHFAIQEVAISATQQNFDFTLADFTYDYTLGYTGSSGDIFHLNPFTISCAIKLTNTELANYENCAINRVKFKSPVAQAEGQLWAQVWMNDNLVSEKAVPAFSYGEFLDITLDNFVPINPQMDYYVGFKVQCTTGNVAWFDTLPRVAGKGAWFRINSWTEVSPTYNHNFVITAYAISVTAEGVETEIMPEVTSLGNNYPNPFNPETNIEFSLAEAGPVTLDIYNIKGQKIKTLANGDYDKGTHVLYWNGRDESGAAAASGIYFYMMQSGRYTLTRKMILMK